MTFDLVLAVALYVTAVLAARVERRPMSRVAASGRTGNRPLVARVRRDR